MGEKGTQAPEVRAGESLFLSREILVGDAGELNGEHNYGKTNGRERLRNCGREKKKFPSYDRKT